MFISLGLFERMETTLWYEIVFKYGRVHFIALRLFSSMGEYLFMVNDCFGRVCSFGLRLFSSMGE